MKRLLWVGMVLVILLSLSGCGSRSLVMDYVDLEPTKAPENLTNAEILERVDNDTPYEELLTKTIDIHEFAQKYEVSASTHGFDLADVATDMGIECLRLTPEGALYSVHRVSQGGLLYIFYANFTEWYREDPSIEEYYRYIVYWFYVQKPLSYEDFSSIREGSTFEDVKRIDPTAQIYKNIYEQDPVFFDTSGGHGSIHYMTDGILIIVMKTQDGKTEVIGTEYIADYQTLRLQMTPRAYPYFGKILDQDRL